MNDSGQQELVRFIPIKGCDPEALSYATSLSSGIDLRACCPGELLSIMPGETIAIGTGYRCKLDKNYEGQIRPRSGLALKYSITVLNSPGTIDADFEDEIKVILHNHGNITFGISHGDRIAQFVLSQVIRDPFYLPQTFIERNGGFGSTGV